MTLLQCMLALLLGAHWAACAIALQVVLHDSPEQTWIGSERYRLCELNTTTPVQRSGTVYEQCGNMGLGSYYLGAFSWSIMVITGTGGTDFYPSSDSDAETLIVT